MPDTATARTATARTDFAGSTPSTRAPEAPTTRRAASATTPRVSDPYTFLDTEPDFAWRSADGREFLVSRIDETSPTPEWLSRAARRRKHARLVDAASWVVTATVLIGVIGVASLAMLGTNRFGAAMRELTGLDMASAPAVGGVAAPRTPTLQPIANPAASMATR